MQAIENSRSAIERMEYESGSLFSDSVFDSDSSSSSPSGSSYSHSPSSNNDFSGYSF